MKFSESWLREWVNPSVSRDELSHQITMAGLEVDRIAPVAPPFEGLVVGHVVSCDKHPNADKLSLCEIDIGDGSNLQIICGAPNVRKDLKVVVATVGSVLPSQLKIKPSWAPMGRPVWCLRILYLGKLIRQVLYVEISRGVSPLQAVAA